ncbi:MAG: DUF1802 family protein [Opitutaceae bacterium]|nr:DUF1802 family protein [Opitutaceae bacterium]
MSPAFKEWHALVEALGSGEQLLILRKGGISEKRGGFDAAHAGRFWLFPTQFHAQSEKTKPAAARFFAASPAPADSTIPLRYFADITHHTFLSDWSTVAALDAHHFWSEAAVREKFDWAQPPGLHAFIVRVHRLTTPLTLPLTADMGGCKSWIDVPPSFTDTPSTPALADDAFATRSARIMAVIDRAL